MEAAAALLASLLTSATSGPNPNTVTSPGSPKEEIRRMPPLVTVSTQIPYG